MICSIRHGPTGANRVKSLNCKNITLRWAPTVASLFIAVCGPNLAHAQTGGGSSSITVTFDSGSIHTTSSSNTGTSALNLDSGDYTYNTSDYSVSGTYLAGFRMGWDANDVVATPEHYTQPGNVYHPAVLSDTYSYSPTGYATWNVTVTMPSTTVVNAGDENMSLTVYRNVSSSNNVALALDDSDSDFCDASGTASLSGTWALASAQNHSIIGWSNTDWSGDSLAGPVQKAGHVTLSVGSVGAGGTYVGTFQCPATTWSLSGYTDVNDTGDIATGSGKGIITFLATANNCQFFGPSLAAASNAYLVSDVYIGDTDPMTTLIALAFALATNQPNAFDDSLKVNADFSWTVPQGLHDQLANSTRYRYNRRARTYEVFSSCYPRIGRAQRSLLTRKFDVDWNAAESSATPLHAYITIKVEARVEGPRGASGSIEHGVGRRNAVRQLSSKWETLDTIVLQPGFLHTGDRNFHTTSTSPVHHAQVSLKLGTLRVSGGGTARQRITVVGLSLTPPRQQAKP